MNGLPGLKERFSAIIIDSPWQFQNCTGKMAPEHKRLRRYDTMIFDEIGQQPQWPGLQHVVHVHRKPHFDRPLGNHHVYVAC